MEPTLTGAHLCEFRLGLVRCGWVRLHVMLLAVIVLANGANAYWSPPVKRKVRLGKVWLGYVRYDAFGGDSTRRWSQRLLEPTGER